MTATMKLKTTKNRKAKAKPIYTHIGNRPMCGPLHVSQEITHYLDTCGALKHALNETDGPLYRALCGAVVATDYYSSADDGIVKSHVNKAATKRGAGITCPGCLRRIPGVQRFRVEFRDELSGEWFTVAGEARHTTKAAALRAMKEYTAQREEESRNQLDTDGNQPEEESNFFVRRFRVVRVK